MRLHFVFPQVIAAGFFKITPITPLITDYQLSQFGVDKTFRKVVTTSSRIDKAQRTYSYPYAVKKRRITGDASKFNLKLTGNFHRSFFQIIRNESVSINISNKMFLSKKYPTLLQLSNNAINIIINGDGRYIKQGLLQYARKYYLTHVITK